MAAGWRDAGEWVGNAGGVSDCKVGGIAGWLDVTGWLDVIGWPDVTGYPDDAAGGGLGVGWKIHPGRTGATLR